MRAAIVLLLVCVGVSAQEADGTDLIDQGRELSRRYRYTEAIRLFERAAAAFRADGDLSLEANAHLWIGYCEYERGEYEASYRAYAACLKLEREINGEGDSHSVAVSLGRVAAALRAMGRHDRAVRMYEQAYAMRRRLSDGETSGLAWLLNSIGYCLNYLGRHDEALVRLREAAEMGRRLGARDTDIYLADLGKTLLERKSDAVAAVRYLGESIERYEKKRWQRIDLAPRERARRFAYYHWIDPHDAMIRAQLRLGRPGEALRWFDRRRFDPVRAAELRLPDTTVFEEARTLEKKLGDAKGRNTLEAKLRLVLQRRTVAIRAVKPRPRPASLTEVRGRMVPGERLLYYRINDNECRVFVVDAEAVRTHRLMWPDGTRATLIALGQMVERYVTMLPKGAPDPRRWERARPSAEAAELGHRLFTAFVPAAEWKGLRRAPRVTVFLPEIVHALPFETLVPPARPQPANQTYWIDVGPAVVRAPVGATLAWR